MSLTASLSRRFSNIMDPNGDSLSGVKIPWMIVVVIVLVSRPVWSGGQLLQDKSSALSNRIMCKYLFIHRIGTI